MDGIGTDAVAVDIQGAVATVTVGSGMRFNAMGRAEWRSLESTVCGLAADPSLRAMVIRGRGGKFSAGSDLREWDGTASQEVDASFAEIEAALQAIENSPVPTIAVVEGVAAGAGCQLALACDLQLVSDSARIGMPTAQLGILVPPSFANRMSVRIGPSKTKELLYGGRLLTAERAAAIGMITSVVPAAELDTRLAELLGQWSTQSAASLRAAKRAVNEGLAPLVEPARRIAAGAVSDPVEFPMRLDSFLHHKR